MSKLNYIALLSDVWKTLTPQESIKNLFLYQLKLKKAWQRWWILANFWNGVKRRNRMQEKLDHITWISRNDAAASVSSFKFWNLLSVNNRGIIKVRLWKSVLLTGENGEQNGEKRHTLVPKNDHLWCKSKRTRARYYVSLVIPYEKNFFEIFELSFIF